MRDAISAIDGLEGHSLDVDLSIHSVVGDRDLNGWSALEEFRESWKNAEEYSAPQYWAATSFLTEMLYRLGGNSFEVRDWVLWALADDPSGQDPFSYLMRLTQKGVYEIEKPEGEITLFFTSEAGQSWK